MRRLLFMLLGLGLLTQITEAQRFDLFDPQLKTEYPSVVYDFLERYLYEIDSLQSRGIYVDQRLRDDKVLFVEGNASSARKITHDMIFSISKTDNKFYEVSWADTLGNVVLDLAFPMQYELLLGKPKVDIEKEFSIQMAEQKSFSPRQISTDSLLQTDSTLMTHPVQHYYVESLNDAVYFRKGVADTLSLIYDDADRWHSACNLFQGCIDKVDGYTLYVEQNLYGFNKKSFTLPLWQWLAYCQAMKLNIYFGIEEEREDGLKALLIAQSADLGFNHMMSVIIPDNFVSNPQSVIKATLNAYIPTQNVKDLYQQYVSKPKKRI